VNAELFTFRQRPSRFLVGVVLVVLLASWAPLALAGSGSEAANRYAAAWERYLAAQTPEALGDIGGTWARFWDTQAVEAVGAYLIPMDLGGADLAASRGFAAANRYAAAWQSFLAAQNPQSMDLRNMGDTWSLFWASVEAGGIVETEAGFEVACCR